MSKRSKSFRKNIINQIKKSSTNTSNIPLNSNNSEDTFKKCIHLLAKMVNMSVDNLIKFINDNKNKSVMILDVEKYYDLNKFYNDEVNEKLKEANKEKYNVTWNTNSEKSPNNKKYDEDAVLKLFNHLYKDVFFHDKVPTSFYNDEEKIKFPYDLETMFF